MGEEDKCTQSFGREIRRNGTTRNLRVDSRIILKMDFREVGWGEHKLD
jgi:hypothetical protein